MNVLCQNVHLYTTTIGSIKSKPVFHFTHQNYITYSVKMLPTRKFKTALKQYLIAKCFYSLEELNNNNFSDIDSFNED